MEVQIGPAVLTVHADDEVLVCDPDGRLSSTKEQGFFAADTRFVSGYRLRLGRTQPVLLNSAVIQPWSARFEFTNAAVPALAGAIPPQTLHLRLDRTVGNGVHEDYDLTNHSARAVDLEVEVSFECDFADLFDVKRGELVRRGSLQSEWDERKGRLTTRYRHDDFERAFRIDVVDAGSDPEFANGGILFRLALEPGATWHTCIFWIPVITDERATRPRRPCHDLLGAGRERDRLRREWVQHATSFETSDPGVTATVSQAVDDLASLRLHVHDIGGRPQAHTRGVDDWVPAAGIPWFVSLFGRDALVVSLQTLALAPRFAIASLQALGELQGDGYDDARDMQPGKIEHEIRRGELAFFHLVPHTPYYGSHDATTLYVLAAAEAWRWHGDRGALDRMRPHVERALAWIDTDGDPDGDGLQEYATRAREGGYYNQGWKDSGDGIVNADGSLAALPIALCELQGYVVAAKRAWAATIEDAYGDHEAATRLRDDADRLAALIEARFWWEAEGTYYLGLDGAKRPIESVTSNPGHLLWSGAVTAERAARVAARLVADDMWSGWGIRTLSTTHVAYNPFSYQRGSVWPHDNALAAAGLRRYGLDEEAAMVARAVLDAGERFQNRRVPELYAGLARDPGGFPVQYLGANVPQAWAAGAVVHLLTTLLGLDADASRDRLVVRPALPAWLERVRLRNLTVGDAVVDLEVRRDDRAHQLDAEVRRGKLDVELG